MCSHIIKIENILNRIFILLPESCPGVGLVGAGGSKTSAWGFAMAPHRLRALVLILLLLYCIYVFVANGPPTAEVISIGPVKQIYLV